MTDMADLNIQELQAQIAQANHLIAKKQKEKVADAYIQLHAVAESVGLTLDELLATRKQKKTITKRASYTVAVKYRNPSDASQTWTGRGKRPRWVGDVLATGKTLEDLLVN